MRRRRERGHVLTAAELGAELGERATLVQFSSAFCSPCRATRTLLRDVDESQVFVVARGRAPASIKDALMKELSLRQQPDIVLSPSWWPWMPLIPFNISVESK